MARGKGRTRSLPDCEKPDRENARGRRTREDGEGTGCLSIGWSWEAAIPELRTSPPKDWEFHEQSEAWAAFLRAHAAASSQLPRPHPHSSSASRLAQCHLHRKLLPMCPDAQSPLQRNAHSTASHLSPGTQHQEGGPRCRPCLAGESGKEGKTGGSWRDPLGSELGEHQGFFQHFFV